MGNLRKRLFLLLTWLAFVVQITWLAVGNEPPFDASLFLTTVCLFYLSLHTYSDYRMRKFEALHGRILGAPEPRKPFYCPYCNRIWIMQEQKDNRYTCSACGMVLFDTSDELTLPEGKKERKKK